MQWPYTLRSDFSRYQALTSEDELLSALKKRGIDAVEFFLQSVDDITWSQTHQSFLKKLLILLESLSLPYPQVRRIGASLRENYWLLSSVIPKDSLFLTTRSWPLYELHQRPPLPTPDLMSWFETNDTEWLKSASLHKLQEVCAFAKRWELPVLMQATEEQIPKYIESKELFPTIAKALEEGYETLASRLVERTQNLEFYRGELALKCSEISYKLLETIDPLSPYIIYLHAPAHSPNFLPLFAKLPHLKRLSFADSRAFSHNMLKSEISELDLSNCAWLSPSYLEEFSRSMKKLKRLTLSDNPQLKTESWQWIPKFQELKTLDVERCSGLTAKDLEIFEAAGLIVHK